ncbi:hypothetical protein [Acaryochloris marina]|uniref:hypothetical protein n=1 Tax=Acaryochloris marina TaxID=155978 RepID=UPI001BAF2DF2|nr:hypothetical protein [Acaryochloris marina]QUY40423.1 hypothetical protein I1H34_00725 [Acaryochloris marina S15]
MTQAEFIKFAQSLGWTAADAKRAFKNVSIRPTDDLSAALALASYAGPELLQRQYDRRGAKTQVTKIDNSYKNLKKDFDDHKNKVQQLIDFLMCKLGPLYRWAIPNGWQKDSDLEKEINDYEEEKAA